MSTHRFGRIRGFVGFTPKTDNPRVTKHQDRSSWCLNCFVPTQCLTCMNTWILDERDRVGQWLSACATTDATSFDWSPHVRV